MGVAYVAIGSAGDEEGLIGTWSHRGSVAARRGVCGIGDYTGAGNDAEIRGIEPNHSIKGAGDAGVDAESSTGDEEDEVAPSVDWPSDG